MSKGLDALEVIKYQMSVNEFPLLEQYRIIEKELKALEIIKKYNFRPSDFHYCETYNIYLCNMSFAEKNELMSEEEYDLLKEVLNNGR